MKRRQFLAGSLAAGAGLLLPGQAPAAESVVDPNRNQTTPKGGSPMAFQQPELPYGLNALQPFLSEEQIRFHYGKHHAGYFSKLNGLVEGKPEAKLTLRDLVIKSEGAVFNNAAQAWNHSFFWSCMSPAGGGSPKGELAEAIERNFGSLKVFRDKFSDAAATLFGSGWAWLARNKQGKLEIMALGNAGTPLKHDAEPLLTIDVWEHAYYLDYKNERPRFVEGFWAVVNWDFVSQTFAAAVK